MKPKPIMIPNDYNCDEDEISISLFFEDARNLPSSLREAERVAGIAELPVTVRFKNQPGEIIITPPAKSGEN